VDIDQGLGRCKLFWEKLNNANGAYLSVLLKYDNQGYVYFCRRDVGSDSRRCTLVKDGSR